MMRILIILGVVAATSTPVCAWERLVTRQGSEIEGDVAQSEFILIEGSGGEVAIPRAAIVRFDEDAAGLKALIKDGTVVTGTLQGKLEIEDGLLRRRFSGTDITSVEFDRYIVVEKGKQYSSCPIRVEVDASVLLLASGGGTNTTKPRAVSCKGLRVASLAVNPKGKIRPGKLAVVATDLVLAVPPGEDQLVDVSGQLRQGELTLAHASKRFTADEGEGTNVSLDFSFAGDKLISAGPPPRLLLQVVSQDAAKEVERGGFFWWFTIPIP